MPTKAAPGSQADQPNVVTPMLATLVKEPFTDPEWLYEVKWDGFRIIAHVKGGNVVLHSRKQQNYTKNYPPVAQALAGLKRDVILDGEIVAIDESGKPNFDELQRWDGNLPLLYYVFDIIWLDGKDLTGMPLTKRKQILQKMLPKKNAVLKYSESFDDGVALFDLMKEKQWEGIIAKRKDSLYIEGKNNKRTMLWQKVATAKQQEFVVGGWAESNSGRPFRTLIFGYYKNGKLLYQGHAGGGFKEKEMPAIFQRLKKLEIKKSPFANTDVVLEYTETPVHWVKPELVIQVKYATTTRAGMIRKPATFQGFREDKAAKDVVLEQPEETSQHSQPTTKPSGKHVTSKASNWPAMETQEITSEAAFEIEGKTVTLNNVEKMLWKDITKADLITYYHSISKYILPHLTSRPLSLHIKHIAPTAPGMYIKDMEGRQPTWAQIFQTPRKHKKQGARDMIDYLVCNDAATLLWLINLGCIDVNPWTSVVEQPEEPSYVVIDLDPSDNDFSKAVETAMAAREFLKMQKITGFAKTSGKTGIHIYLPCEGFTFPQARTIAENICSRVHELVPEITTTSVSINARGDKLYLDPNQNDFADTVAAPYSVRPYKVPSVSTPLEWKEIKPGLNPEQFDINVILNRVEKKGELFAGVLNNKTATSNSVKLAKWL